MHPHTHLNSHRHTKPNVYEMEEEDLFVPVVAFTHTTHANRSEPRSEKKAADKIFCTQIRLLASVLPWLRLRETMLRRIPSTSVHWAYQLSVQHMEIVILFRKLTSLFTCILRHQMMRWHSTISFAFNLMSLHIRCDFVLFFFISAIVLEQQSKVELTLKIFSWHYLFGKK